jgi:16S rRNA (guanine527-N7)-methyltransferase
MTEDEAQAWLRDRLDVSRETMARLDAYREMVIEESAHQNLISAATIPHFWARHIVDSAQLLGMAASTVRPEPFDFAQENPVEGPERGLMRFDRLSAHGGSGIWLDLGSGAGLPGIVVAILSDAPILLVEERRKRHEFLSRAVDVLSLPHAQIYGCRLELVPSQIVSVITARAFAPLPKLFALAQRFSRNETVWLLPKGKSGEEELENARASWQGVFHVEQSVTDAEAAIIVARGVHQGKRRR